MSEIDTGIVPVYGQGVRICRHCGQEKDIESFSLSRGKHSQDRKTICVPCETRGKKAKRYDISLEQYDEYLKKPCFVCGCKSERIVKDDEKCVAVLCKQCDDWMTKMNSEEMQRMLNFVFTLEHFPILHRWRLIQEVPEKISPLLNYIERHENQ